MYPLVVLENSVANDQKLTTLMSSSGRISYIASNFLRFWRPGFIEDPMMLESKDRLQGRMRAFSKEMMSVYGENRDIFKEATKGLLKENGFVYEEDLFGQVFDGKERGEFVERAFAVHKFLFEGAEWIKDGQWSVSEKSSGPYTLRPVWQRDLLNETRDALSNDRDLKTFQSKVLNCLKTSKALKPETLLESLLMKCLKAFSEEFYVNVIGTMAKNPFKEIVDEALLGVAIVDSQAQAKELLKILTVEGQSVVDYDSKPLLKSFLNSREPNENFVGILKHNLDSNAHEFGELPVYLIDPEGTVEVDDGFSIERVYGNDREVILHVHVADPSDLVQGDVENEARRRAESVYLAERKIPMLPDQVTQVSTLRSSGVRTFSFSCRINLENGQINDQQIRKGIINRLNHLTYEEAGAIVNDPDLDLMRQVAKSHLKYRNDRGHLDISFPRGVARIDKDKNEICVDIERVDDLGADIKHAVAEAMIIAGRIAGEYLMERKLAAPFRNHMLSIDQSRIKLDSLLEKYEVLKHMSGASVDLIPKRHASMGLDVYVKVTSPLRRYLDLATHRILKEKRSDLSAAILNNVHRQEVYNKKLSQSVNRYWIERFIWQKANNTWTLIPLEKLKEGMWTVHVEEVASNFMVQLVSDVSVELGVGLKARLIGKPHESILRFERVREQ